MDTMMRKNPRLSQLSHQITLLGGAQFNQNVLALCLNIAPELIALDGAADSALILNKIPLLTIGDMDSISEAAIQLLGDDALIYTPDQDRTDFDKALELLNVNLILAVGFSGGRRDHELACYHALLQHPDKNVILISESDICFHLSRPLKLHLPLESDFALFPMAPVTVNASGLKYPLEQLVLSPFGKIGTSNKVNGPEVTVAADAPGLLVILPLAALDAVIDFFSRDMSGLVP